DRGRLESHAALVLRYETGHEVEDRGLARSVWTDQPRDAPGGDRDRAVVDRNDSAKTLAQALDLEQGHGAATGPGADLDGPARARHLSTTTITDGMMPRGRSRITTRNTAAYRTRYRRLAPKLYASQS